jgi:hypothetical protein
VIAALRDPSPEFAERVASAAGDLAVGVTGLLRALSGVLARPGAENPHAAWAAATSAAGPPRSSTAPHPRDGESPIRVDPASNPMPTSTRSSDGGDPVAPRRPTAKKAVKKTGKMAAPGSADGQAPTAAPGSTEVPAADG